MQDVAASECLFVWALAMHKSQGQMLSWTFIDLGTRQAFTGFTFVCLSRVNHIDDLLITPIPSDRLGKLGASTVLKSRLTEEVRLMNWQ